MTLTIQRGNAEQQVRARLGELTPESARSSAGQSGGNQGERLGITVAPLTPDIAAQLNLPRGTQGVVIQSVDPNGPAAQAGLQAGDVIQQVNRQPVRSPDDIRGLLAKAGDRPPLLLINRGGQTIFVAVPLS